MRFEAGDEAGDRCSQWGANLLKNLERVEGIEPSTRSLGSYCSTTELHPRRNDLLAHSRKVFRIISA